MLTSSASGFRFAVEVAGYVEAIRNRQQFLSNVAGPEKE